MRADDRLHLIHVGFRAHDEFQHILFSKEREILFPHSFLHAASAAFEIHGVERPLRPPLKERQRAIRLDIHLIALFAKDFAEVTDGMEHRLAACQRDLLPWEGMDAGQELFFRQRFGGICERERVRGIAVAAAQVAARKPHKDRHEARAFPFAVDAVEDLRHVEEPVIIAVGFSLFHTLLHSLPSPAPTRGCSEECGRKATSRCFPPSDSVLPKHH